MRSGPYRGTVTATRPPGLSTRAISANAVASSGMCSSTSEAMTRSTLASGTGRVQRSPRTASARAPAGASAGPGAGGPLAGLGDRREPPPGRLDLVLPPVDGDHRGTAAIGLERVPPLAAAQVEHRHARLQVETVVVDCQHACPFRSRTSAYQSAVRSAVARQV